MKQILMGALAFAALSVQLSAATVSVTFTGSNGQKDNSGNLISPYTASVNGVSTTIYCDDFANTIANGQTYTANETNLASGNLSLTRYGAISSTLATTNGKQTFDGQELYEMTAWLTTQFSANSPASNSKVNPPTPSSNAWLFAAESNYSSLNASGFSILTNTSVTLSGSGQVQEFVMAVPVAQAPEPASMGLLGLGMILLSIFGWRKWAPATVAKCDGGGRQ
jgi:hypothetical protein